MPPSLRVADRRAMERELGSMGPPQKGGWYFDDVEETPELQFPQSIAVYNRMRRTDGQVAAVMRAMALPIRGARWQLVGSDVRPEVMELVRINLGLVPDERGMVTRDVSGVNFSEYLRHALLHVPMGFMAFEQVYQVGPPGPGLEALGNREVAHIRKLAPRLPWQVSGIDVARDGGLEAIRQNVRREDGLGYEEVKIGVESLVMLTNDQEGADWAGNSILRGSYKHYIIKDGLERIGPMVVERNGMGLVVVKYPPKGDRNLALAIARAARAGEDAGVALPDGYSLELIGVTGQLKDELPLLKYHAEAIGKNALEMLLDLGHDAGARSLGDTFLTFLLMALDAIAGHIGSITTRHVIADLVKANFGKGETYPVLKADPINPKAPITTAAVKELVEAGILTPSGEDEVYWRRSSNLPMPPGLPVDPPSQPVDRVTDVPSDAPGDEPEPGDQDPPPPDPEEPPESEGEVPVKPHKRRKPGTATRGATDDLQRRLASVQRKLDARRARADA